MKYISHILLYVFIASNLTVSGCSTASPSDVNTLNTEITRTVVYQDKTVDKKKLPVKYINAVYYVKDGVINIQIIYNKVDVKFLDASERILIFLKGKYIDGSEISSMLPYMIRVIMRPQAGSPIIKNMNLDKRSDKLFLSAFLELSTFDVGVADTISIDISNIELRKAESLNFLAKLLTPYEMEVVKKYYLSGK